MVNEKHTATSATAKDIRRKLEFIFGFLTLLNRVNMTTGREYNERQFACQYIKPCKTTRLRVASSPVFGRRRNMNFGSFRRPLKLSKLLWIMCCGRAGGGLGALFRKELPMEIRMIADTNPSGNGPPTGTCFLVRNEPRLESVQCASASAVCRSKLTRSPLMSTTPALISCWPVQSKFS